MKLIEAFLLSLLSSLFLGALVFLGLPRLLLNSWYDFNTFPFNGDYISIFGIMYAIYVAIQAVLSTINGIQAYHVLTEPSSTMELKKDFLTTMLILYLIVFVGFFCVVPWLVFFVFLFSLPYIICCAGSVFIFLKLLKSLHQA